MLYNLKGLTVNWSLIMLYLLIFILLILIYMMYEAGCLKVEEYSLDGKNHKRVHDRTTCDESAIRIMHISDIHIGLLRVCSKRVINTISSVSPDLIIMTGDYFDRPSQVDSFFSWIDKWHSGQPIYMCLGNHDNYVFKKVPKKKELFLNNVSKRGLNLLINESRHISLKGKTLNLIGIDDFRTKAFDIEMAFSNLSNADNTIVFSHNPDIIYELKDNKPDLLLCGHFHGGQIWMPFRLEYKLFRTEKTCTSGIFKGFHTINGIKTYINRGLGNVALPLRLFSKPEITIIYY